MKKFNELFAKFAMVALLIGAMVAFSSCEEETTEASVQYYSMGWDSFHGTGVDFGIADDTAVQSAFKTALGVDSKTFSLEGTASKCNAQVVAACAQAEAALASHYFTFVTSGEYVVYNTTKSEEVAVYTYKK